MARLAQTPHRIDAGRLLLRRPRPLNAAATLRDGLQLEFLKRDGTGHCRYAPFSISATQRGRGTLCAETAVSALARDDRSGRYKHRSRAAARGEYEDDHGARAARNDARYRNSR